MGFQKGTKKDTEKGSISIQKGVEESKKKKKKERKKYAVAVLVCFSR